MSDKPEVLRSLDLGARVAEEEQQNLAEYFVETDQWRRIFSGEVDIIYGPKGSGKSAIYTVLLARETPLFDRGTLLVSAENPTGTPAFKDLVVDPPASEEEFVALWKLYVLSLVGGVVEDYEIGNEPSHRLLEVLRDADLLPPPETLSARIKAALAYVRSLVKPEAVEAGVKIDPASGLPVGFTGKIVFREPTRDMAEKGVMSLDELLVTASKALEEAGYTVWLLFDRLDVAFADSPELEANALRALFRVYLDVLPLSGFVLKIFLRSDIWRSVTESGFREASHITRTSTITWDRDTLLNLVMQRLVQSDLFVDFYGVDRDALLTDLSKQNKLLTRVFPPQVDSGRNPATFDWMVGRIRDGTGQSAPRELIHLLSSAREQQLRIFERGGDVPDDEVLIDRQALRDALPEVSKVRLEQTLYAEHPTLRPHLEALNGEKTEQYPETLAKLWRSMTRLRGRSPRNWLRLASLNSGGQRNHPAIWVPFIYRPILNMVQGTAEVNEPSD